MKAFVVYPTYRTVAEGGKEKAVVHLFGRLENGESFETITPFKPYFWIKKQDLPKAKDTMPFEVEQPGWKDFSGEEVVRIVLDVPRQVPELRQLFEGKGIGCYEADIRFPYRFMMDHSIKASCDIKGDFRKGVHVDRVYDNPEFSPAEWFPELKALSIDVETNPKTGEILAVALHTGHYSHCFLLSEKTCDHATSFSSEEEMLRSCVLKLRELDPDIVTGWNLIDFDLHVLHERCEQFHIDFFLGREDKPCKVTVAENFFESSRADIPGRQALDGIQVLKGSFVRLDDYRLSTAAKKFLQDDKLIGDVDKLAQIDRAYREDTQLFVDYNLKDAKLALDILKASGTLDLTLQRSLLTGMPLERVSASIASLDQLYIRELARRKVVAPSLTKREKSARTKGGFVMQSKPGIYKFILVHDFKSLYPSIMRTFNIDPYSYVGMDVKGENVVRAVNGACFRNDDGILPQLIQHLWEQRDKAKKEDNKRASHAIKILMNSFYGVLANPTCRFFSSEIANAITNTGQYLIKLSADKVRELGYDVIYGDTDSIFTDARAESYAQAERVGKDIQGLINGFYATMIKERYHRRNFMELEFEKVFIKFMMPTVRNSDVGAKKRYAGIVMAGGKEQLEFTGLEFVRSDWTGLAKKFQVELLGKIFHEEEVTKYIKDFVEALKAGKYDDLLVYRKAIRKDLAAYTKTTPPHVKAARMLEAEGRKLESSVVRYLMTENGPEPVEIAKSRIDYDHYIEKQVRPIADSVLSFYDATFDEIVASHKQKTLFSFS
ncbi:MAG: DNA polymerase II [Nanoarchaeota archaeon]